MHYPVRVLFICYRNAIRSQVAEALLRRIGGQHFQVCSAGIQPEPLDPLVMETMGRLGIDISGHMSKPIDHFIGTEFDYIITLCDRTQGYVSEFPGHHTHIRWHLPDPAEFQGSADNKRQLLRLLCTELNERIRMWVEIEQPQQPIRNGLKMDQYWRRLG